MKRQFFPLSLLAIALLIFSTSLVAQETHQKAVDETTSTLPALSSFHEVIFPMWHQAYPEKNYVLLKELGPKVAQFAKDLPSISLPGILRDKKPKWDVGVRKFVAAAKEYEEAIRANDQAKMLLATEKVHGEYEGLVRVIRPVSKELDAYHVVLYKIYHHYLPDMKIEEISTSSVALLNKCGDLMKSVLPKNLQDRAAEYDKTRKSLCVATGQLAEAVKTKDKTTIQNAVNDVHTKYQTVEKVFE